MRKHYHSRKSFTRRDFLRLTGLAGSAALALVACDGDTVLKEDALKIIVVGAGASGLMAARRLHNAGHQVIVLEARERIGGRVLTDHSLAPHPIELGAEFVHGGKVVTWDSLKEYDLDTLDDLGYRNMFIHTAAGVIPYKDFIRQPNAWILNDYEDLATEWKDGGWADDSLAGLLTDLAAEDELNEPLAADTRQLFNNYIAADYGSDLADLGLYGVAELTYEGDGGDDFRIVKGYTTLMDKLAEGLDIRLESVVERIAYTNEDATLSLNDGSTHSADRVVVTLPLGVLKAGAVTFDPPLPSAHQRAITGLGAGHVDKIVLKFDAPFWDTDSGFTLTHLDSQMWWRPGWGRSNEAPILTALIGGQAAHHFESLGEQGAINEAITHLEAIFGMPLADRLVEGRFIDWGTDPFSRMGYSYVPVNGAGLRDLLAESVNNVLYFAGEASHRTRAATVHGAFETGIRAAEAIINT